MDLVFEQIRIGGDRNFGYLLGDRNAKVCILIDPAYTPEQLVERAKAQELKVTHIVNTHGHGDHINGNAKAVELTGAPVAAHPDSPTLPDVRLADNTVLEVGSFKLRVLHTPGHCEDHLILAMPDPPIAITGDLIFVGKVGGTTTDEAARIEWNSLQRVLRELPDATTLWPGHDYGIRPSSTMGLEKRTNPFLRCKDLAAFIQLKRDWPVFKQQHGLK
ncbi:MAG: MBL fold metallo-hydrolase [Planctomycetes bacterium]|nr:MBL fold metallo-hydrolase [Planctomycetota bacterium]